MFIVETYCFSCSVGIEFLIIIYINFITQMFEEFW
jgi:hypothetical protein